MATQKDIQNEIHVLLTSTRNAKETKVELVKEHIEPQDEAISGSMFKAVVIGYDLTEGQWGKVRKFLKEKGHSQGAINQIARFMSGQKGHDNLTSELKKCTDTTVEGRIKYLQEDRKLTSYKKLYKACCPPSDEAVVNKLVKQVIALAPELQKRFMGEYKKVLLDIETEKTETALNIEVGKRHKMATKDVVRKAMAISS